MIKLIKWLSHKMGYKIALLKAENGTTFIDGDKELLKYVDTSGFFFKKEPIKRSYPKRKSPEPIKPLTKDEMNKLGLSVSVDVADCKNHKEASKVQEQVLNGEVKISVMKTKNKNL